MYQNWPIYKCLSYCAETHPPIKALIRNLIKYAWNLDLSIIELDPIFPKMYLLTKFDKNWLTIIQVIVRKLFGIDGHMYSFENLFLSPRSLLAVRAWGIDILRPIQGMEFAKYVVTKLIHDGKITKINHSENESVYSNSN